MVPGEKFSTTTSAQRIKGSETFPGFRCASCRARGFASSVQVRKPGLVVKIAGFGDTDLNIQTRQAGARTAFDLDDVRAQIAQGFGGNRADQSPRKIENANAGERSRIRVRRVAAGAFVDAG